MNILRITVLENPTIWPKALPIATITLNSAFDKSVGDSPHFLVYVRDLRMPYEEFLNIKCKMIYNVENYRDFLCLLNRQAYRTVQSMLEKASATHHREYDIKLKTRESTINVGDRVYCKSLQAKRKKKDAI